MPFCHFSGYNMWILKATKLNQGQGIHVCNSLPQVKQLIQKYCEGISKKETEPLAAGDKKQKPSKQSILQLQTPGSDKGSRKQQLQTKSVKRSSRKENGKLISNSSMRKIDQQSSEFSDSSDQHDKLPIQSPKANDLSPAASQKQPKKARLYSSP